MTDSAGVIEPRIQIRARELAGLIALHVRESAACARDAVAEADPARSLGLLDAAMDELAEAMEHARRRSKMLRGAKR